MTKKAIEPLVSRETLEGLIDSIPELASYERFLKVRWIGMIMWWHNRSMDAHRKYLVLRAVVIAGGVLIPFLSAMSMNPTLTPYAPIAIAFVGALVAGAAAWEGVANYGEVWREKRRAAELLKVEGWQFLQRCGKYQEPEVDGVAHNYQVAFPRFAAEVEGMIAKEVGEYLQVFDASLAQVREHADEITDKLVEEVLRRVNASAKPPAA